MLPQVFRCGPLRAYHNCFRERKSFAHAYSHASALGVHTTALRCIRTFFSILPHANLLVSATERDFLEALSLSLSRFARFPLSLRRARPHCHCGLRQSSIYPQDTGCG
jgi:hypothetical protein